MQSKLELAKEIEDFLAKHAKMSAMEPEEYSSPDASLLATAAALLRQDKVPTHVWSSWGSGGYKPYNDDKAKSWHDALTAKIQSVMRDR